jgi:hypothetical protein
VKRLKCVLYVVLAMAFALPFARGQEREWTNKAGSIIKAVFVSADDQAVTLTMKGKNYRVKLADLSPQSQALAKELQRAAGGPKPFPHGKQRLTAKLGQIQIPKVQFFQTPLPEALDAMMKHSWENDVSEANPAAKGVHILTDVGGQAPPNVTITLNNMPLSKMLDFTTEMVGWSYEVKDDQVVVSKKVRPPPGPGPFGIMAQWKQAAKARGLEFRIIQVNKGMVDQMGAAAVNVPRDPFGGRGPDLGKKVMKFLTDAGIQFDEAAGHQFAFDGFQIFASNTPANIAKLEHLLNKLRAKTQKK